MWETEGINLDSPIITLRKPTCQKLYKIIMQEDSLILIKGTPFSGKSALAQLFVKFIKNSYENTLYFIETPLRNEQEQVDMEYTLKKTFNKTSEELYEYSKSLKDPLIIIIDEAQLIYQNHQKFWDAIKKARKTSNIRVLCFSGYGTNAPDTSISTPVHFTHNYGNEVLHLEESEANELFQSYNNSTCGNLVPIPENIQNHICLNTNNHVGLVKLALYFIYKNFQIRENTFKPPDTQELIQFLLSKIFFDRIKYNRAIPDLQSWKENDLKLLPEEISMIRKLILHKVLILYDENEIKICHKLARNGYINCENTSEFLFASDLIYRIFFDRFLRNRTPIELEINLEGFILMTIERMSSSRLCKANEFKYDHVLYERAYQMEFYEAMSNFVPLKHSINVDVPPPKLLQKKMKNKKEKRGFLDFYLNESKKWGIELMREGIIDKIRKHLARFEKGGKYTEIPLNDYVVVDFQYKNIENSLEEFEGKNYVSVILSEDFKEALVKFFKNGRIEKLLLKNENDK